MSEVDRHREDGFGVVWAVSGAILGLILSALASASKFAALIQLLLLPVIVIAFVTTIAWAVVLLCSAYRLRWKRTLSTLAALPAALLAMPGLWSDFDIASEVRLFINRLSYDRQIAALPDPVGRRQTAWSWGGNTTAITGGSLYWLVYDETDSLSAALRAGDAWPDADHPRYSPFPLQPRAEQLWRHFYLVEETVR